MRRAVALSDLSNSLQFWVECSGRNRTHQFNELSVLKSGLQAVV